MLVLSSRRMSLALVLTLLISGVAQAETRWLIDQLWVNVRTGAGDQFRILQTIPSGTSMETLGSPQNGFVQVRLEDGTEGWIPERFLQDEPTAALQLESLQNERDALAAELAEVTEQYEAIETDGGNLGDLNALRAENDRLASELRQVTQASENAIALDQRNQQLTEENAGLRNELDILNSELSNIRETRESRMMLSGGGLIVAGLILGIILPRMRAKRRDAWG
ncbi:MAG: TIGR04211 family SH3 domain-containing protein [Saccharospirillum sp.]